MNGAPAVHHLFSPYGCRAVSLLNSCAVGGKTNGAAMLQKPTKPDPNLSCIALCYTYVRCALLVKKKKKMCGWSRCFMCVCARACFVSFFFRHARRLSFVFGRLLRPSFLPSFLSHREQELRGSALVVPTRRRELGEHALGCVRGSVSGRRESFATCVRPPVARPPCVLLFFFLCRAFVSGGRDETLTLVRAAPLLR